MSGSTVTVTCWGCDKSETHPMKHGAEDQAQKEEWASRGWRRKAFWSPNWDKGPWFCSDDCANHSYNAVQANEYWQQEAQKEFEAYCKETEAKRGVYLFMITIFAAISIVMLGECIYARL
jgi:hypothetical protein